MPLCDCCRTFEINYQLHDLEIGPVRLCRRCFLKLDGRLSLQNPIIENVGLDAVYERNKTMIEKVKAEMRKDEDAQLERMWALDGSKVKEGAVRR